MPHLRWESRRWRGRGLQWSPGWSCTAAAGATCTESCPLWGIWARPGTSLPVHCGTFQFPNSLESEMGVAIDSLIYTLHCITSRPRGIHRLTYISTFPHVHVYMYTYVHILYTITKGSISQLSRKVNTSVQQCRYIAAFSSIAYSQRTFSLSAILLLMCRNVLNYSIMLFR